MSQNKKQFGVWMDGQHATVVGKESPDATEFTILGHADNESDIENSSEKGSHNAEKGQLQKYFKDIAAVMVNVDELHVTGTGTAQEQFIHWLADTPQYKNTVCTESTSNKMSDEKLLEFVTEKY